MAAKSCSSAEHGASEPLKNARDAGEASWNRGEVEPGGASEPTSATHNSGADQGKGKGQGKGKAPAIFTQEEFENMATAQEHGKYLSQCVLRARLLATADEHAPGRSTNFMTGEVDLTLSKFGWRAMLMSLPAGAGIVGTGVCRFVFRKLHDPCRPGYIIFEVTRTDGSTAELHFFKHMFLRTIMVWALYL